MRTTAAVGAIFYTLLTGWITVYASVQVALYTLAAFELILALPLAYGIHVGWLGEPPSIGEYSVWLRESEAASESGEGPGPRACAAKRPSSTAADFEATYGRPLGTTRPVPVVLADRFEAARYWVFWVVSGYALAAVAGYSTKLLLSSMFVLIFGMPEMTAVRRRSAPARPSGASWSIGLL